MIEKKLRRIGFLFFLLSLGLIFSTVVYSECVSNKESAIDIYKKGSVEYNNETVYDLCNISNAIISEVSCSGEGVTFEMKDCPGGCKNEYECKYIENETYFIRNITSGLKIKSEDKKENYRYVGHQGIKRGVLERNGLEVANLSINFTQNWDWSDVKANVSESKSFLHVPSGHEEIVDMKLKVPVQADTGYVYVCPDATSLDEVYEGCSGGYEQPAESQGGYYQIDISSTGALETTSDDTSTIPEFNLVGMILIIAITGIALYFISNRKR